MGNYKPAPFLTPKERKRRIEAVMRQKVSDDYPDGWTWYKLAQEMNSPTSTVDRAFKHAEGLKAPNPSLRILKQCARALGVTVGFLVDRKET